MLSADGKDPGTAGFTHFLELPLRQTQYLIEAAVKRQYLLIMKPEPLGLRDFDIENIADRLAELAKVYELLRSGKGEAAEWDQRMIEEIGEDLFSTLLSADLGTTAAGTGSVSLRTQISALQKVLSAQQIWFDFTDENWRTQLGQLLWQPKDVARFANRPSINERDILLLQIALSAELAVRLEIAHRLAASKFRLSGIFAPGDLEAMLNGQTEKLEWDVVVFQRFIECFRTTSSGTSSPLRRLSFISAAAEEADMASISSPDSDIVFQLRMERDQWDGLRAFASTLSWPEPKPFYARSGVPTSDTLSVPRWIGRPESIASEYDTPPSSPISPPSAAQGTPALILVRSQKMLVSHSALEETMSGLSDGDNESFSWLAKTWLSGFFLPGAAVDQILLHTLLEVSPGTKFLLPESLSNSDGFVYRRRMYWSKESVVGRVLASLSDAKECAGWISLPFVPQGQGDGWIQTLAKDALYASMEPRINSDLVARTSDPLRGKDSSKLQAGDFITVLDGPLIMGNEAQFEGISLNSSDVKQYTADGFFLPKVANLSFTSPRNPKLPALTIPLSHAVHFVSSFPCYPVPPPRDEFSTAHDPLAPIDSGHSTPISSPGGKGLHKAQAHPLHVDYTYNIMPAAALLSSALPEVKDSDSLILMDSPHDDNPSIYQIEDEEVVVLDCRGSSDLEVLARAWCAKVGENALVAQSGRTCLSCSIREAIGLGMGVSTLR